jgi:hypothetical protein
MAKKKKEEETSSYQKALDTISNAYDSAAKAGYLGTGPKVAAEEKSFKRGDAVKKKKNYAK